MKFAPIDAASLPTKNSRRNSETDTLVQEFVVSGTEVAELDPEGKKVETVRTSLQNAINRLEGDSKGTVKVMSRGGRLFLLRQTAGNGNVEAAVADAVAGDPEAE